MSDPWYLFGPPPVDVFQAEAARRIKRVELGLEDPWW